jgi:hypothetical protein
MVGGKVLGIGPNMQQSANERVPSFVEGLWKITCLFVIVILTLNMTHLFNEIGGFNFPLTAVHGLVIFYLMASLRDFFLVRFYFSQDF